MSHDAGDAAFDFRDCSVTLHERAFPPRKDYLEDGDQSCTGVGALV